MSKVPNNQPHKTITITHKRVEVECERCRQPFLRRAYATKQRHCPACHKIVRKQQQQAANRRYCQAQREKRAALLAAFPDIQVDASPADPAPREIWNDDRQRAQPTGRSPAQQPAAPPATAWEAAYLDRLCKANEARRRRVADLENWTAAPIIDTGTIA